MLIPRPLLKLSVWFGLTALALTAVSFAGQAPELDSGADSSVIPESRTAPAAVTARPRITRLVLGPAPQTQRRGERIAATFITDSPEHLTLEAEAETPAGAGAAEISWRIAPPAGFSAPDGLIRGRRLKIVLRREGGNPSGQGDPLAITVTAALAGLGVSGETSIRVQQDLEDRLRQEYVDLARQDVPSRAELINEAEFARLYGKKFPNISFKELNFSVIPGSESRYPVVLATPQLVEALQKIRAHYGRPLVLSSGYRNPVRQTIVHAEVQESHHQYGRAADLYVAPRPGRGIATEADWLRLAAASVRGSSGWVEPMLSCHVNTAGCHVHVDVGSGRRSRIVTLSGRVVDTSGRPVAGGRVLLAGMPAVTSPEGRFSLKHVLTAGRTYSLTVETGAQGPVETQVAAREGIQQVNLVMPASRIAWLQTGAQNLAAAGESITVQVNVQNVGLDHARQVELDPDWPGAASAVRSDIVRLDAVQAGATAAVPVTLRLPRTPGRGQDAFTVPLQLRARYTTGRGEIREQLLHVPVKVSAVPAASPKPAAAAPAVAPESSSPRETAPSDSSAAAGGLLVGGAAAAARALKKQKASPPAPAADGSGGGEAPSPGEASVLPGGA